MIGLAPVYDITEQEIEDYLREILSAHRFISAGRRCDSAK